MSALPASGTVRAKRDHDGCRMIPVVAHAQREVLNAAAGGERSGLAVKAERTAPRRVAADCYRAPVGPETPGPQGFDGCFLCSETHGETRRRYTPGASSAVRRLMGSECAPHVTVAETVER